MKASPVANEATTVDYSSATSVFPAEACETIGGEACLADIYPEVKLNSESRINVVMHAAEAIERDYSNTAVPKRFSQQRLVMIVAVSSTNVHTREVFTRINREGQTQQQKRLPKR